MRLFKPMIILFVLGFYKQGGAQVLRGTETSEIIKIAETYRLSSSMSFQTHFTYTDSARMDSVLDQLDASYKIKNGKYWSQIDSIIFLQGANYNVAIYQQDSVVMLNKKQDYTGVMQLPLMDSFFRAANIDSMAVTALNDSTNSLRIYFNSASVYHSYVVQYDPASYLIRKVIYYLPDSGLEDNFSGASGIVCVTINFSGYSANEIDESVFDENQYIYNQGGTFYVQVAYNGFRLIVEWENNQNNNY